MCITKSIERLTPRERQVLDELLQGRNNIEIAENLGIALHTAQDYIRKILLKTNKPTRLAVVVSVYKALVDGTFVKGKVTK